MSLKRTVIVALVLAATTGVPAAQAMYNERVVPRPAAQDLRSPDAQSVAPVIQDLRSPDARDAARLPADRPTASVTGVPRGELTVSTGGFPWLAVGLPTGLALALIAAAAGTLRRRHRMAARA
jgi:hypothetical protein